MTSLIEREQASIKSPRSPGRPSSGQFSFKGSLYVAHNEKDWIEIQKNTFTNWCNVQIHPYGVQITSDLAEAFQDGLSLVYLVESISTKKVGRYNKNPRLYAQKLENITSALKLLQSDGIKLVNIGLIWRLILHYQISSSGSASGKQLLLLWLKNAIPDMVIRNVTTDWNDGRALSALNEFCQPGLNVRNFNTDWNDGKKLLQFLEAQCPGIVPGYENIDRNSPLENAKLGLDIAEEKFGVRKVLTPEELVSPDVDELSVMAYMLQFRTADKLQSHAHIFKADGNGIKRGVRGKTSEFFIYGRKDIGFDGVRVHIRGPDGEDSVPVETQVEADGSLRCKFVPFESGIHTISVKHYGKEVPKGPFQVMVHENVADVTVSGVGIKNAVVFKPAEFIVQTNDENSPPVSAVVEGPTKTANCNMEPLGNGKWRGYFVPREVGEHKIRIEVGDTPLLGSPFTTKVGDPTKCNVAGSETARNPTIGRPSSFDVDTSGAGLGELAIQCRGPVGNVPVDVKPTAPGRYNVSFTPNKPGEYNIHFVFNGDDIPGSPVKTIVSDPSRIVAHGDGLHQVTTDSEAEFFITLHGAGDGELKVYGEAPYGHFPVDLLQSPNEKDTYIVRYTPQGVADPRQVTLNTRELEREPKRFTVRHEVDIPVQVPSSAGEGQLEAAVVGPDQESVPSSVTKDDDGYYHIRFVPRQTGEHRVMVMYGGKEVSSSPYVIRIRDATSMKVKVTEMEQMRTGYSAQKEVDVPIEVPEEVDEISATVQDEDGKPIKSTLTFEPDGLYHVRFVPHKPGRYTVDVRCGGQSIENSPFVMKISEAETVSVKLKEFEKQEGVSYHVGYEVDVPMEIPSEVDEVSAVIYDPDGNIDKSTFKKESDGLHHLRFTPKKIGQYKVDIRCGGRSVENSPFPLNVAQPKTAVVRLRQPEESENKYLVRRELDIALDAAEGTRNLSSYVDGPDEENVPASFDKGDDGLYHVKFVPYKPGTYKVHVKSNGTPVASSPFLIKVGDPGKVQVAHVRSEELFAERVIKNEVDLAVESSYDMTDEDFSARVTGPDGENVPCHVNKGPDNRHHVRFTPHKAGPYKVDVRYRGEPVQGSPFTVNVTDQGQGGPVVNFNESDRFYENREADIPIMIPEGSSADYLKCRVTDPEMELLDYELTYDRGSNLYHVRFVPKRPGRHRVDVEYDGVPVDGSPFMMNIEGTEGHKKVFASGDGIKGGMVNEKIDFMVDARTAGRGKLTGKLTGVKYHTDVEVIDLKDGRYACHYLVPQAGAYVLSLMWNGQHIPNSPYKVTIREAQAMSAKSCFVEGSMLKEGAGATVGQAMGFSINSKDAGPGQLYVRCQGPTKDCDCTVFDNKDSTYQVQIFPSEVGNHLVYVEWGGRPVHGSPFLVRVGQPPDPSKVRVYGPGLENGLLRNFKGEFLVETKGAGPGTLKIRIHGPRGAFKVEMYRDTSKERSIGVRYNPTEAGRYIINIKWADQHIPGSPFDVTIVETRDELESLNELKDNAVLFQQRDARL
ncbi:hypothetical protein pdam_00003464 [Pocillopora damicornis]|uniref:Calponin-homology (CH) domain-containing protein n=1 Tax=Pocillopora damicornis TaxID=46731 RepID=A0A3M6V4S7_POCDA|nr:hypothetical protein pdam_00003464 [Pocillopora damicornis]